MNADATATKARSTTDRRRRGHVRHIDVAALGEAELDALIERLDAEVSSKLFAGLGPLPWRRVLREPTAREIDLYVAEQTDGALTGFVAIQCYTYQVGDRQRAVLRSVVGMLPESRGGLTAWLVGQHAIRFKLRHPLEDLWYASRLSHPAAYHLCNRVCHRLYPRPDVPLPSQERAFLRDLATRVGYRIVEDEGDGPLVAEAVASVRDADHEQERWVSSPHEDVQWFNRVTGYPAHRRGILAVFPLNTADIALTLARYALDRARRGARRLQARLWTSTEAYAAVARRGDRS